MDINILESYNTAVSRDYVEGEVQTILAELKEKLASNTSIIEKIFSCIDLTSLNTSDSRTNITNFIDKVNKFEEIYPDISPVAAICLYPSFTELARKTLVAKGVSLAVVAGVFPSSQSFLEIKTAECKMAIEKGADEVDVVIPVGALLDANYEKVFNEVRAMKEAVGRKHLKVILETGELNTLTNVKIASILSMEAGADFTKTSTGKVKENATLEASYVMCTAIKEFEAKHNRKVGFKPAGGISTLDEALDYASVVSYILGEDRIDKDYFRFGASRLANSVLKELVTRKELKAKASYF
ncbi:deoxyribose-phosphate aldolase [Balneicella halophila]|uniref:Deoxyribose-phosphate aldolase n=1 Tax=Balneicella halophila TaxID=1537566 RepID=A0A7L4UQX3_BALHA|nr:deoxyribose-phosphate aldolase [Balneicella halophila]PVX52175.1 deoxyribose-phosphate aldolase [Balneicella halophila]